MPEKLRRLKGGWCLSTWKLLVPLSSIAGRNCEISAEIKSPAKAQRDICPLEDSTSKKSLTYPLSQGSTNPHQTQLRVQSHPAHLRHQLIIQTLLLPTLWPHAEERDKSHQNINIAYISVQSYKINFLINFHTWRINITLFL